jgi:uncharacterized membrane protein
MIAPIAALTEDALPASHRPDPEADSRAGPQAGYPMDHAANPIRTRDVLHLAEIGVIDERAVARALELAGRAPTARGWRIRVERLLLGVGIALLAAGVICFVAYNWAALPHWGRFALAQSILLLVLAAAIRLGLRTRRGTAALTLAIALIGPLLALYGQTYQTGAELPGLFVAWAALALPWTLAARTAAAWLLWLAIVEAGLLAHLTVLERWGLLWLGWFPTWAGVCLFNLLTLVAWESLAARGDWLRGRLGPRLVATALVAPLTVLTCLFLWSARTPPLVLAPIAWSLVLAGGYVAYRRRRVDLVMLALGWVSLTIVLLAVLFRLLDQWSSGPTGWLLGALLLIAASALGRQWLRRVDAVPMAQASR